jgi:hypothetical protein
MILNIGDKKTELLLSLAKTTAFSSALQARRA